MNINECQTHFVRFKLQNTETHLDPIVSSEKEIKLSKSLNNVITSEYPPTCMFTFECAVKHSNETCKNDCRGASRV